MLLTYDFFSTANYIYKEMQKTSLYFFRKICTVLIFAAYYKKKTKVKEKEYAQKRFKRRTVKPF